jgi:polyisoprenoid-binding protein YceI
MKTKQMFAIAILLTACSQAFAIWNLDVENSTLTFVSTKSIDISEVHSFTELAGRISDKGKAVVTIEMASVDTGIPIRDERMQEMLFETDKFPLATARSKIDMKIIDAMVAGESITMDIEFTLDLHGVRLAITSGVVIAKLDDQSLLVTSAEPIIVAAASANMSGGIEALRGVANLPSIGDSVPVTFVLLFEKSD